MNKDDVRLIADQCFVDRRNNVIPTKTFMGNDDELQNFAARLEAEWMKDAKPAAWREWEPEREWYVYYETQQDHSEPLYLHPAPIPEGMVLVPSWVLETAKNLAKHMAKEFYPEAVNFDTFDDLAGVISQIDNMVCGLPTEAMIAAAQGEK